MSSVRRMNSFVKGAALLGIVTKDGVLDAQAFRSVEIASTAPKEIELVRERRSP